MPAYIDRVLEATNPANLPVQLPTKFETLANLKSALRRALPRSPKNVRPTGWLTKLNVADPVDGITRGLPKPTITEKLSPFCYQNATIICHGSVMLHG
ncbi:MAG: hypothetical protein WAK08_25450 [Pseudolabrys sp.]